MTYTITESNFDALALPWADLLTRSSTDNIFLTPQWQSLWWQEVSPPGELCLLAIESPDHLEGIAPLLHSNGTLTFVGNTELVDYQDFIVSTATAPTFFSALAGHLIDMKWSNLCFQSIPHGTPTLEYLPQALQFHGIDAQVTPVDVAPGIDLPTTWEAYIASLRKKDRHELRRKFRHLEEAGSINHYYVSTAKDIPTSMDDFLRLLRTSRQEKAIFMTSEKERFFRALAAHLYSAGFLRLYFLELNGVRVSSALCLDYKGTRLLYNSGYDHNYSSLAVGVLLTALCIKDAIEVGIRRFDFLRGDEHYKYQLGGVANYLYALTAQRA